MNIFLFFALVIVYGSIRWYVMKYKSQGFQNNLKKIYRKYIFIIDVLFTFIFSYTMLAEGYKRSMSFMSSLPWLLLGVLFFVGAIRKILKKPPVLLPLFKQLKTILFRLFDSASIGLLVIKF